MTDEQERAARYQAAKDAPDAWDDAEVSGPERGRPLGSTISVRLSAEDTAQLRILADQTGVSFSEVVRRAVETYIRPRIDFEFVHIRNPWFFAGEASQVLSVGLSATKDLRQQPGPRTSLVTRDVPALTV
jgi:Ribbon-helix-helix protein, copG family